MNRQSLLKRRINNAASFRLGLLTIFGISLCTNSTVARNKNYTHETSVQWPEYYTPIAGNDLLLKNTSAKAPTSRSLPCALAIISRAKCVSLD